MLIIDARQLRASSQEDVYEVVDTVTTFDHLTGDGRIGSRQCGPSSSSHLLRYYSRSRFGNFQRFHFVYAYALTKLRIYSPYHIANTCIIHDFISHFVKNEMLRGNVSNIEYQTHATLSYL